MDSFNFQRSRIEPREADPIGTNMLYPLSMKVMTQNNFKRASIWEHFEGVFLLLLFAVFLFFLRSD